MVVVVVMTGVVVFQLWILILKLNYLSDKIFDLSLSNNKLLNVVAGESSKILFGNGQANEVERGSLYWKLSELNNNTEFFGDRHLQVLADIQRHLETTERIIARHISSESVLGAKHLDVLMSIDYRLQNIEDRTPYR